MKGNAFYREIIRTIETLLAFLTVAIGFYPAVSDAWNGFVASKMISKYESNVRSGVGINGKSEGAILTDENGVMGYLEIPVISVTLPIYEGTSDEVLAKGVGHTKDSSLPVGGAGTHTVLTGHRGLPSARLFTDLDKMNKGDIFFIHSSGKKLVYEVTDIRTVLPYETESLSIMEGQDLATLVTCTPYGVNTHRLLVTGARISSVNDDEYKELDFSSPGRPDTENIWGKSMLILAAAALALTAVMIRILWIWLLDWPRKRYIQKLHRKRQDYSRRLQDEQ